MLISFHISKTAGTAFRIFLEANLGRAAAFAYAGERRARPVIGEALSLSRAGDIEAARDLIEADAIEMIHGHIAHEFLPVFPEAATMTWLRDPVRRAVSEWLTMKRTPDPENPESLAVAAGEASFEDFLERRRGFLTHCVHLLSEHDRPLALFAVERADAAEDLMRRALDWRGGAPARNRTPDSVRDEADKLCAQYGAMANEILSEDIALHRRLLSDWDEGAGAARAAAALRHAPHRRAASPLRRARRAAGVMKERAGRILRRDWA